MKYAPGTDCTWRTTPDALGQTVRIVDPTDPKLRVARPILKGVTLVLAANGQLVWVADDQLINDGLDEVERILRKVHNP